MKYNLAIEDAALDEIEEAYKWYDSKRTNLGDELLEEIEDCYNYICRDPERYSLVTNSKVFRRMRVARFPYIIVYRLDGNIVVVVSVKHIKQK